jgi:hypothetical protein
MPDWACNRLAISSWNRNFRELRDDRENRRNAVGRDCAVTESQWLACQDDYSMLLTINRDVHVRKLRLFACACARRLWRYVNDERSRRAVEVAERYADDLATRAQLAEAQLRAGPAASSMARIVAFHAASDDSWSAACLAALSASRGSMTIKANQAGLVREIFGNPFRPIRIAPTWLAWEGGTVAQLAQAIYEDGDYARLPILADALEEAGCQEQAVLNHLHWSGDHFRGCWALDALLGKD